VLFKEIDLKQYAKAWSLSLLAVSGAIVMGLLISPSAYTVDQEFVCHVPEGQAKKAGLTSEDGRQEIYDALSPKWPKLMGVNAEDAAGHLENHDFDYTSFALVQTPSAKMDFTCNPSEAED
jgi:hypothetical protein